MSYCQGFPPSVDNNAQILILGSMPGKTSLAVQQYYAHPQNRFWRLMGALFAEDFLAAAYQERLQLLLKHHVALWDAVDTCERSSSLDSDIRAAVGNDFAAFLQQYPQIKTICLNGNAAWQCFRKTNPTLLTDARYRLLPLPSTSPANARYTLEMLYAQWQKIKTAPDSTVLR